MLSSDIRSTNLNLLVALDALLEERSVTRAAARVGLTQSGMSNALAQLRRVFDDPLFVRAAGGVEPTTRALELREPVKRGLHAFEEALAGPATFDPRTSSARFVVAMNDYAEWVLGPPLVRALRTRAPGVSVQIVPAWGEAPGLDTGEVDVAVLSPSASHARRYQNHPLLDDAFTCIVRKGHPRITGRLTLARYLAEAHVLVTREPGGHGDVDTLLARMGKQRTIGARVPRFFTVPHLVAETDLVALVDTRVARSFAKQLPLRMLRPPLRLPASKTWAYHLMWHPRSDSDPAQSWLRGQLAEVAKRL